MSIEFRFYFKSVNLDLQKIQQNKEQIMQFSAANAGNVWQNSFLYFRILHSG